MGDEMIQGIGIDLCDITRIEKALKHKGFKERVFSEEEIEYAESKAMPARHFAASFAAKEAMAKATGWGIIGLGLNSLYVRRTKNGPKFIFSEETAEKLYKFNISNVLLSISYEGDMAVAMVVLEKRNA